MRERRNNAAWIIMFVLMICCAHLIWPIAHRYVSDTNYENRLAAEKPAFSWRTREDYPAAFEAYYNDRLPFRMQLIQGNSAVEYFVFHNASNVNVVRGKNGWLFYNGSADDNPVEAYKGMKLFTDEELACIARNLTDAKNKLEERGIEFVLFVAPNKERVYPEKMPDYYGEPARMYRTRQLVEYLNEKTDIRVVYPYEELMEAKETYPEQLYYRLDTHWNYIGAYIGSSALMRELGIAMPPLEDLIVTQTEPTICDLADMLYLRTRLNTDADYVVSGYDMYHLVTDKHDLTGEYIYHCEGADGRKLFMLRDSFADAMDDFVASQFDASYMVHYSSYSHALVDREQPDIFVYEIVERRIGELLRFKMER